MLNLNLNPRTKNDLIKTQSELRQALELVKGYQLKGEMQKAGEIINLIALSSVKDPFGESESTSSSIYDYTTPFAYIVKDHYSKLAATGIANNVDIEDVMHTTWEALCSGKLLCRDLSDMIEDMVDAKRVGDIEKAQAIQEKIDKKSKMIEGKNPINAIAQFVSYNGSKPGDMMIDRILGGHTVKVGVKEEVYVYRLNEKDLADAMADMFQSHDIESRIEKTSTGIYLLTVSKEEADNAVARERGNSGLLDLLMKAGTGERPVYENGKAKLKNLYVLPGSTYAGDEDGEAVSLVDYGDPINVGKIKAPDEIVSSGIQDESVSVFTNLVYDAVMQKVIDHHYSTREFKMFCCDASADKAASTKYRDSGAIMMMLHTLSRKMFRVIKDQLNQRGLLSDKLAKTCDEASSTWSILRSDRGTGKVCARDIIIGCVAYTARNDF